MKDSRKVMDALQEKIGGTQAFDRLRDAVYECIENCAGEIAAETGYDHAFVHIALQEMVGTVDRYTAEEIDAEVEDLEG